MTPSTSKLNPRNHACLDASNAWGGSSSRGRHLRGEDAFWAERVQDQLQQ